MRIIGHIGQDPVIKAVNGHRFVSVAVDESHINGQGQQIETTQWFDCSIRHFKLTQHLTKSSKVAM